MKRRTTLALLASGLLGGCAGALPASRSTEDQAYLFSYFLGNGADGLHFAASRDGYHWEALRGGATTGVGRLQRFLVPVLEDALERSLSLAAGMDTRGYGRSGGATVRERWVTGSLLLLVGLVCGILAVLAGRRRMPEGHGTIPLSRLMPPTSGASTAYPAGDAGRQEPPRGPRYDLPPPG